jgi:hypothetical protein
MKYKHVVAILIIGLICWFFGYWAKITHQSYAHSVFNAAIIIILSSGVLALIKIFLFTDENSTLNK